MRGRAELHPEYMRTRVNALNERVSLASSDITKNYRARDITNNVKLREVLAFKVATPYFFSLFTEERPALVFTIGDHACIIKAPE